MIIALAGRKGSGKSTLASVLTESFSFRRVSFADPIKDIICDVLGFGREHLQENKDLHSPFEITEKQIAHFSALIGEECYDYISNGRKSFDSIRDLMQYLATDIIRKHDEGWHARKTLEHIRNEKSRNFVIDDLRFPNEMEMLSEAGAECWYVVRNRFDNVSNHESETSLSWDMFGDKVFINDSSEGQARRRWKYYVNYCLMSGTERKLRDSIIESFKECDGNAEYAYKRFSEAMTMDMFKYKCESLCATNLPYICGSKETPKITEGKVLWYPKDGKHLYIKDVSTRKKEAVTNLLVCENLKMSL